MRVSVVIQVIARILRIFSVMFLVPAGVALIYGQREELGGFLLGGAITAGLSELVIRATPGTAEDLRRIEALAVVAGTWLVVAHLGAIPYVWVGLAPIDALFESMSGFTTTGATILVDFDELGRGMMFLAVADTVAGWDGCHHAVRGGVAPAGVRRPTAVLHRDAGTDRREAGPPHQADRSVSLAALRQFDAGGVHRVDGGGHAVVRRRLPCDDDARGRGASHPTPSR